MPAKGSIFDQVIDEIRDEVFHTVKKPGEGYGDIEQSWFNGVKECRLKDMTEVAALIEATREFDRWKDQGSSDSLLRQSNPDYNPGKWNSLRDKFQDAVDSNCDCKKIWL
jgi:hypothetical protein